MCIKRGTIIEMKRSTIAIIGAMKSSLKIKEVSLIRILMKIFMILRQGSLLLGLIVSRFKVIRRLVRKVGLLIMAGRVIPAMLGRKGRAI